MTITICIVAFNEEDTLKYLFQDILKQDFDHSKMEILLVDSSSSDGTKKVMQEFSKHHSHKFMNVLVLDNERKRLPSGWNVALKHFTGDVILRIDAHASISTDFVTKNMNQIMAGENIVGGYRPNILVGDSPWKQLLLLAESSMFGSSIASYRRNQEKSYVKSVFHGAYRRSVFATVGGYHENLWRTEDNEMHYRMGKAGYQICFDPEIISYQHTRTTLHKMLKQKYSNGYWIGLTLGVCPGCVSIFHLVPWGFIMGILVTSVAAFLGFPWLAILMWGAYGMVSIGMTVASFIGTDKNNIRQCLLPFLFLLLHVSYGMGTLIGLIKMPFWRRKNKICAEVTHIKEILNG